MHCAKVYINENRSVNGTPIKGVTHYMKESFLKHLGPGHEVTEFYPEAFPQFCTGCKNCFLRGEAKCPHLGAADPIWQAFLRADLLVFAYPVYALRAPASVKSCWIISASLDGPSARSIVFSEKSGHHHQQCRGAQWFCAKGCHHKPDLDGRFFYTHLRHADDGRYFPG